MMTVRMAITLLGKLFLSGVILIMVSCALLVGPEPGSTPEELFDEIWKDYSDTYALFEVKNLDWDALYREYRPQVSNSMSDRALFNVFTEMLGHLDDQHVSLMTPFAFSNAGNRLGVLDPFSIDLIRTHYLEEAFSAGEGKFTWGRIAGDSDIGYVHVAGFAFGNTGLDQIQDWAADIDIILEVLSDTKSLIVDNRGNRGGLTGNVTRVASRMATEEKVYAISRTKNGKGSNDYSLPVELRIKPAGDIRYTKPIIFLTNRQTISAGEYFTLAMTSQAHVTHTGSATAGAFSLSLERFLVNGWRYTVSVQQVSNAEGTVLENRGIIPEAAQLVENNSAGIAAGEDYQLEHAIELGRQE